MKKGIVVYDTSYGNTEMIGEAIARTLRESSFEVDFCHLKNAKKLNATDYDFLIVGSPTRFGTMSYAIHRFIGRVKSEEWANKPFAAFDTENPENIEKDQGSAAEKIAERLEERKLLMLAPVLKAQVLGQKGPLVEGEVERAKQYARALAAKLDGVTAVIQSE